VVDYRRTVPLLAGLTAGLLDDASAVVPGGPDLSVALDRYRQLRGTTAEDLAGPLLVPASAVPDLRPLLKPDDDLAVALVADTGLTGLRVARDSLQDDVWVRVVRLQLPVPHSAEPADAVRAVLDELSFTVPTSLVVTTDRDLGDVLAAVAADGAERVALRYDEGGPTTDEVADFLLGCASYALPTTVAGDQRRAVHGVDADTGRGLPGHLNCLAAAWAALDGADHAAVSALLETQDPDILLSVLTAADVPRLRALLVAAASGDMAASADELRRLGLLDEDPAG
jgi:hypothetical protein